MANGALSSAGTTDKRVDRIEEGLGGIQSVASALTRASYTTACAGADNDLVFTAVNDGLGGNDITVAYVQQAGTTWPLSIVVSGNAITVNVKVTASSIASTAAEVLAAVKASVVASKLVDVQLKSGDNGTGVVTAFSAAPLTGGTAVTRSTFDAGIASGAKRPTPVGQVYTDEGQGSKLLGDSVKASQPTAW